MTPPPPGYSWSPTARFATAFGLPTRLTTPWTECKCGARRGEHGPNLECPAPDDPAAETPR